LILNSRLVSRRISRRLESCIPDFVQEFLELGWVFAEGAHRHFFRRQVEAATKEGGADALATLVRHRTMGKLSTRAIRGHFLLGHLWFLD
jgi:hypothetical protein